MLEPTARTCRPAGRRWAVRETWTLVLALLLVLGPARAQDDPPIELDTSPSETTRDLPGALATARAVKDTADDVARAHRAGESLKELAERVPWLVADELLARGAYDQALAFAKAAPPKWAKKLPHYIESRRDKPDDIAARKALLAARNAFTDDRRTQAIAALQAVAGARDTVPAILAAYHRGLLKGGTEGAAVLLNAARSAEAVGWMYGAGKCFNASGLCSGRAGANPQAVVAYENCLRVAQITNHLPAVYVSLVNLARAHDALSHYSESTRCGERALRIADELGDLEMTFLLRHKLATSRFQHGEYARALEHAEQALPLAKKSGKRQRIADVLWLVGAIESGRGRVRQALEPTTRALEIYEVLLDVDGIANSHNTLGNIHKTLGEFAEALEHYERAAEGYARTGDRIAMARVVGNCGAVYHASGNVREALKCLERARRVFEKENSPEDVLHVLRNTAACHLACGDARRALEVYERVLRGARELEDRAMEGGVLTGIANAHARLGDCRAALEWYGRAERLAQAIGDHDLRARALLGMAGAEGARGHAHEALRHVEDAHRLRVEAGDRVNEITALLKLETAHRALGNRRRGREQLARARELAVDVPVHVTVRVLSAEGRAASATGDYVESLQCYERALELATESNDLSMQASLLEDIGSVHRTLACYPAALAHQRRALGIARRIGARRSEAHAYMELASIHNEMGAYEESMDFDRRALGIFEEQGVRASAAAVLNNIGSTYWWRGDYAAALEYLQRALEMQEKLGNPPGIALGAGNVGGALARLGKYDEAEAHLTRALTLSREFAGPHIEYWAARLGWLLLERKHRPAEAVAAFQEAIQRIEEKRGRASALGQDVRAGLFRKLRRTNPYAGMAKAQEALGRTDEALRYLERGRAREVLDLLARSRIDPVAEAERRARERRDENTLKKLAEVRRALEREEREIGRLTHQLADQDTSENRKALEAVRAARNQTLSRRARIVGDLVPMASPASPAQIQAGLEKNERLLFYLVLEEESLVVVVPPLGKKIRILELTWPGGKPVTDASLTKAVDVHVSSLIAVGGAARGMNVPAATKARPGLGAQLGHALVPPELRRELKGLTCLYVVPHAALHRLPFELLAEMPPVAYVPSGSVLRWCRARRDEQRKAKHRFEAVALGDPIYSRAAATTETPPLAPLPGTRREVESIRGTLAKGRTSALLGEQATKARLFELAPQARYLHLATHQLTDETEWRSYTRLALTLPHLATPEDDGFLSLHDLFEHWRDRLSGCELVVLSACETQRGPHQRDEGPYAMPLGFLYAGTPAVIASLWRVDDQSTADLFSDFYRRLAKGKGKLEAFTEARKALRKKYPEPYYWAPFIYIGDPR